MLGGNDMRDLCDIIDKIKIEIALKNGTDNVFDKEVAHSIGISANKLTICKHRNSIPFREILDWCKKNNISVFKIFYKDCGRC